MKYRPGTNPKGIDRFGHWTILDLLSRKTSEAQSVLCRCDCGTERVLKLSRLVCGRTSSCGCIQAARLSKELTVHGMYGTPEYGAWMAMKSRCSDQTSKSYARYGGRGISVCENWKNSFSAFYEHIGQRPSARHSVDRYPDNDGNYEPGNVRWATPEEQQGNRGDYNHSLTFNGETKTLSAWAREVALNVCTLRDRLRRGWPLTSALSKPADQSRRAHALR